MDRSDEELLAACGRDRAAFGLFYECHERSVLGFFGAVTRRPELAATWRPRRSRLAASTERNDGGELVGRVTRPIAP